MKPAITATKAILVSALAAGLAFAQSPARVHNTGKVVSAVGNHASVPATASSSAAPAKAAPAKSSAAKSVPAKSASAPRLQGPMVAKRRGWRRGVVVGGVVLAGQSPAAAPAPENGVAAVEAASESASPEVESEQAVVPDAKYSANGRRDPFISPVVSHTGGSGCSTGKKCLEIGAVNLRGVVRSESGFIAVVSNGLNKAYFLRENDPVFNGYVVKITGDSIVFQETVQDRLGKTFTREVVKKITTPAV